MNNNDTAASPKHDPAQSMIATAIAAFKQTPRVLSLIRRAYPVGMVAIPLVALLSGPVPVLYLYTIKKMIDGVQTWLAGSEQAGRYTVLVFFLLASGLRLMQWALEMSRQYLERVTESRLACYIESRILEKTTALDLGFFETTEFFDKLHRAREGISFRPFAIMSSVIHGITGLAVLAGYAVMLAGLGWWVVPAIVAMVLPSFLIDARLGLAGWFLQERQTQDRRRMRYYGDLLSSTDAVKEIRLFGIGPHFLARWTGFAGRFLGEEQLLWRKRALLGFAGLAVQILGSLALIGFATHQALINPIVTLGSLFAFIMAIDSAQSSVYAVLRSATGFYENNLYVTDLFDLLRLQPTVVAPATPVRLPDRIEKGIRLESVCFRYPGCSHDVLKDISLTIKLGEKLAIVGENGAGKTTLVKLLSRLYDPSSGRIMVDQVDLRKVAPSDWQDRIGVIFQDYQRYSLTARENVALGNIESFQDEERIIAAADLSGASTVIRQLPHGWETMLGKAFDDGYELSIGQWQKVALARAFFRDSQILILDEPTASLDAKQEYETFSRFSELTCGKTTILISHRLSNVRMADRIIVLEDGRIVEGGSHKRLMQLGGRYASLYRRQAAGYSEP